MQSSRMWILAAIAGVVLLAVAGLVAGPAIMGDGAAVSSTADAAGTGTQLASAPEVTVYKSPTCGCCGKWIEHMQAAGFTVNAVDMDGEELVAIKQRHGVTRELSSCHTAVVGDYVVEGHVPADLVARLLQERPDVRGLAVPGMPIGSPGMEVPGREPDSYDVLAFDANGTRVYERR